jgi:hypothetical protein
LDRDFLEECEAYRDNNIRWQMSGIDISPFRTWFATLSEKEKYRVIGRLADECLEDGATYNFKNILNLAVYKMDPENWWHLLRTRGNCALVDLLIRQISSTTGGKVVGLTRKNTGILETLHRRDGGFSSIKYMKVLNDFYLLMSRLSPEMQRMNLEIISINLGSRLSDSCDEIARFSWECYTTEEHWWNILFTVLFDNNGDRAEIVFKTLSELIYG